MHLVFGIPGWPEQLQYAIVLLCVLLRPSLLLNCLLCTLQCLRATLFVHAGQNNMYFNLRALLGWLATSALHACFILVMVLIGADGQVAARLDGNPWTFSQCGVLMYSIVVITVHLQLAVILDQWTWLHHVSIWLSIGAMQWQMR